MSGDRSEWLERRRTGLGGSDIAGVLGLSPWSSPWSVWADKCGLTPLEAVANDAMEFGTRAEPMLRAYFEDRTGLTVYGEQREMTADGADWMRCTVDGFAHDDGAPVVVEFKTTSQSADQWADAVPVHYQCQATWALAVTGLERVMFGVLHIANGRPLFRVYTFDRDADEIAFVVDRCRRFWFDHVTTGIPPAADGAEATTRALSAVYGDPEPMTTVAADDATAGAVEELRALRARLAVLEETETELENVIRAAIGPAEALTVGDAVAVTWKAQTANRLDATALRARLPRTAARFTTTSTSRVLRLKTTKPTNE